MTQTVWGAYVAPLGNKSRPEMPYLANECHVTVRTNATLNNEDGTPIGTVEFAVKQLGYVLLGGQCSSNPTGSPSISFSSFSRIGYGGDQKIDSISIIDVQCGQTYRQWWRPDPKMVFTTLWAVYVSEGGLTIPMVDYETADQTALRFNLAWEPPKDWPERALGGLAGKNHLRLGLVEPPSIVVPWLAGEAEHTRQLLAMSADDPFEWLAS